MNPGSQAELDSLCAIFGIAKDEASTGPDVAFQVLLHLYGMPLIQAQPKRHAYGNEILAATQNHFDAYSPFVGQVGTTVAMMQEFPFHFTNLNLTTAKLVSKYKSIEWQNTILKFLGLGISVRSAANSGLVETVKTGNIAKGIEKLAGRAAGRGGLVEAGVSRLGMSPKSGNAVVILATIGGTIAYFSGQSQMAEIRAILLHRFQSGDMSNDQYHAVFGTQIDPNAIRKYWEYR